LDFEGIHDNSALGNNEPEKAASSDAEYTLEGIQADIVLMTPLKDDS
jgi:hypothetical protein